MLEFSWSEAASRVGQLEGPEEVGSLLEIGANGVDLVDQVFHADDAVLAKVVLDQLVVSESNTFLVDLAVSTLVDELTDRLEVGVAICDVGIDDGQHLLCSLGELDEDTVVDLEESEELQNLSWLGSDLVDTLDSDDEDELGLFLNIETAILSAQASESDLLALGISVFLDVGLGSLEDGFALLLVGLCQEC